MKTLASILLATMVVLATSGMTFAASQDCDCLKDRNSAIWVEGGATVGKKTVDPGVAIDHNHLSWKLADQSIQ